MMEESKLYNALKQVYDLTMGAYGDPVIQEDLYNEIENALQEHETFCKSDEFVKDYIKEHGSELTLKKGALMNAVYLRGVADGYAKGYDEGINMQNKLI
jgi:hypothetical protein